MSKKLVAVSQRFDKVSGRNEARDCLDVNFAAFIEQCNGFSAPVPSHLRDIKGYLQALNPAAIILSGGNNIGSCIKRDQTEAAMLEFAIKHTLPVLGVCRGMQFLNMFEGGSLESCTGHVGTRHHLIGEWASRNKLNAVNSYHEFAITQETCSRSFNVLALAEDDVIEAFEHLSRPWLGIMWHPEREAEFCAEDIHLVKTHLGL